VIVIKFSFKDSDVVKYYTADRPGISLHGIKVDNKRPVRCDIYAAENTPFNYWEFSDADIHRLKDLVYNQVLKAMHPMDHILKIHSKKIEKLVEYQKFKKFIS
jgi:hypothetical protein